MTTHRVRFPPSPTGPMHIGTARTLLFNFLFAKKNCGTIVFRSEDTDRERSRPEFEQEILAGIKWLGMNFDFGPFRQSERYEIYENYFERLKASGAIYECFCTSEELEKEKSEQSTKKLPPKYAGKCRELATEEKDALRKSGRKSVWRFRVPAEKITFHDLVRGEVTEDGALISDFVVRKSDGQFLYHFTVVADDIEMQITHVIRGEDHISNTPKHILIFRALGATVPEFAHLPLLLNKDRSKMSKRDESGKPATIKRFQEEGYLPTAVMNYLALLGWHPTDEREFFTLAELTHEFDLARVQKAGAIFDLERLNFMNQHYIRALPVKQLAELIQPFLELEWQTAGQPDSQTESEKSTSHTNSGVHATKQITPSFDDGVHATEQTTPSSNGGIYSAEKLNDTEYLEKCVGLIQEKIKFLAEAPQLLKFFFTEPEYDVNLFVNEKMKVDLASAKTALEKSLAALESINHRDFSVDNIQATLLGIVASLGVKNGAVLWPVRVALTGEKFSPGAWEVASVLGKNKTLERFKKSIVFLSLIC